MLRRPRCIRSMVLLLVSGLLLYFSGGEWRDWAVAPFVFAVLVPLFLYRVIARAVDQHTYLTAPKTVTFHAAGVAVAGGNYKSELEWNFYKGFSEDGTYFYLHAPASSFDGVVPKSAFTPEQQDAFRQYAKDGTAQ